MLPGRHARLSLLTRFSRIYLPPRLWVAAQPGKHRTVEDDSDFYCVGHLGRFTVWVTLVFTNWCHVLTTRRS